ncbi:MAG: anti-sigma factor family protein [Woeseiaceae bacterium]
MNDEHVGEMLSGYIDGELTQQQRQRVEVHCSDCSVCERELEELTRLRADIGASKLSQFGEDTWRETMADTTTRTARGIGWLLLIGGVLVAAGIAVFAFLTDPSIEMRAKLIAGAIYGGLAFLFVSVLRQRLIERKTDKYKDVEI